MGLDISVKGLEWHETHHSSYGLFYAYRCEIAYIYNTRLGYLYKRMCMHLTSQEIQEMDEIMDKADEGLQIFLEHSDCGGKLTPQECKKVYLAIKDYHPGTIYPRDGSLVHDLWLSMLEYCWKHRRTMWFA